ncbi:MAG: orotidine 5'-phosphate decarboxylase / HUMPS family protein, partial [Candidatus Nanoarchaeia archaeon]
MILNEKQLAASKKIYMAWDLPSLDKAIPVLKDTQGLLKNVKINSLYVKEGDKAITELNKYGMNVFLDLKFYDIPGTVENHCYAATKQGVKFLTVHAHGGVDMMKAALKGATKASEEFGIERPKILGITVLTSFTLDSYLETLGCVYH